MPGVDALHVGSLPLTIFDGWWSPGLVFTEALAHGLSVIASEVGPSEKRSGCTAQQGCWCLRVIRKRSPPRCATGCREGSPGVDASHGPPSTHDVADMAAGRGQLV